MSKYTTELRNIIESGTPVFDFNYPFYDEEKRLDFQKRFIRHFYFHEIGFETVGMFKLYLENKFNEVLPYYNEMFRTAQIQYDPSLNYGVEETYTKTQTAKTDTSNNGEQSTNGFTSGTLNTNSTQENTANSKTTGSSNTETTNTENTENTGTVKQTNKNTVETENSADVETEVNKAHSDTPQGKISLTAESYVSDLDKEVQKQSNSGTGKETANGEGETESTDTNKRTGTGTENLTSNTETNSGSSATNTANTETENTTRASSETFTRGTENKNADESFTRSMKGVLGVQAKTELLEKHLAFQRKIQTIELQFFDECQDLFMQIW